MAGAGKSPGWKLSAGAAENAKRVLPRLAAEFFEVGREAVGGNANPRALHKLRLRGKRLRYCLEIFAPCYGPGIDRRIDELKTVQGYLGEISDCSATIRLLRKAGPADSPESKRFAAFLQDRERQRTACFLDHWRTDFDAAGRLEAWLAYLKK